MASFSTYFGMLFFGLLVQITHQVTTSITTDTMVGATSVVATPSTSETMTSVIGSISAISTQAPKPTAISTSESVTPVQASLSATSTQALVPTATSTSESVTPVQASLSATSTQALLPTATSTSESIASVQASIGSTSTQAPISTSTIHPVTTGIPYSKPVIVQGLKDVTIREGLKLVMKCKATGFPQPYFIWQKENIELKNSSRIMIKADNSLTILNITRHDAGQYECIARNAAGLESASVAVVKVNYISDVNITIDKTTPVHEGTDIKLTCAVHSHPRVFFTWTRNGEKVDGYMIQITVRNGLYVGVLHRRKVKREMGGNYTCLARSYDEGLSITASKLLHVRLADKPTYPPLEEIEMTAHTITVPIHNIKYLGNGKKVRQIQVIVQQLQDGTLPPRNTSSYGTDELGPYSGKTALPYIAAVLDMHEYKNSFVLGDDNVYSTTENGGNKVQYRNVPLGSNKYYTGFQRMVSDDNDHESLDWIKPIKTPQESKIHDSEPNLGLILGLVLAFVVIGCVIAFFIWKFLIRNKRPKSPNNSTDALEMYPEREMFETPERPRRPVHF